MSFAKDLIEQGDYEEAVAAASRAIEEGDDGPEPLFDRATANELAEHYDAAVNDFEAAIAKNRAAKDVGRGVTRLDRYAKTVPDGAHLKDVADWQKRLRGEMPSLLDKTKELNAP
jgi:hypothetical protein